MHLKPLALNPLLVFLRCGTPDLTVNNVVPSQMLYVYSNYYTI